MSMFFHHDDCPTCDEQIESLQHESYNLNNHIRTLERKIEELEKENKELKLLLQGSDATFDKISKLVDYHGQYRDLVEAVEIKLFHAEAKGYNEGYSGGYYRGFKDYD